MQLSIIGYLTRVIYRSDAERMEDVHHGYAQSAFLDHAWREGRELKGRLSSIPQLTR